MASSLLKQGIAEQMGARATSPNDNLFNKNQTLAPSLTKAVTAVKDFFTSDSAKSLVGSKMSKPVSSAPFSGNNAFNPASSLSSGVSQQLNAQQNKLTTTGTNAINPTTPTSTYTGPSVVDYLSSIGKSTDFNSRSSLAKQYGIANYSGTAQQNTELLNKLRANQQSTSPVTTQVNQFPSGGQSVQTGGQYVTSSPSISTQQSQPVVTETIQSQPTVAQTSLQQVQALPQNNMLPLLVNELLRSGAQTSEQIKNLRSNLAEQTGAELNNPIPLEFQTGRISNLRNQASAQEAALQGNLENIRGLLGQAIQANMPVSVSPETTLVNPVSAQSIYGLGGPGSSGADNYMKAQALRTNAEMSSDFQAQAAKLSIPIEQIDAITPKLVTFMKSAGINRSDAQFTNSQVLKYLNQVGGGVAQQYQTIVNELKAYTGQIMQATGSYTPTEIGEMYSLLDPSNLSPKDLEDVMAVVKDLGQQRLQGIQHASNQARVSGVLPYLGAAANVSPSGYVPASQSNSPLNAFDSTGAQATAATIGGILGPAGILGLAGGAARGLAGLLFKK